ncbi:unnamed protein product [Diamesa hyperborea]
MYQSSKSKSSFRIADILHQNTTDSQLLAQHLMFKNASLSHGFGHEEMFKKGLKAYTDDIKNDKPQSSTPTSPAPENSHDQNIYKDDPCKPSPMYSNFPLGFPLGIHPAFHPAAAYYADAMHKATSSRIWPFYHPYSATPFMMPCGGKRKGGQVRFTPNQTQSLERRFASHKYLSPEDRRKLAIELSLSDRQVKTWFQNRRAKWRRANNSSGSSNQNTNDNLSSGASSDGDDSSQRPLQIYLHHQQYYNKMKELKNNQSNTISDDEESNVDV